MQLNGIIPINKPKGFTSFDVIAKMRGILKMKKLGHSGTLDPMAEGVLPVFAGSATKAISLIPHKGKKYTAGFKLGITTDTQDITGKILSESNAHFSFQQIDNIMLKFSGKINQLPPMYSAVSVNGKRLYEYARQGIEVERKTREVYIYQLDLFSFDKNTAEGKLTVSCSGGTYVRTLIHDIGQALGCGAVMTSLERTYSNGFYSDQCITLEQLEEIRDENKLESIIIPVERLFSDMPEIHLSEKKTQMYKNGVKLHLDELKGWYGWEKMRVYSDKHEFIGLASANTENNELRILKNLSENDNPNQNNKKTSVALGIFDGIHAGHGIILNRALSYTEFTPAVFTFITETIKIKHGKPFEYIYPNSQKLEIIERAGFSYIEAFNFESLKNLNGEEFIRDILIGKMNAGIVVCGENFHFGKNAVCNAEDLKKFGEKYGFKVEVITLEMKADNPVSSELVREYLHSGKIRELHDELDFHYHINATVVQGNKIGRTIDFPTINQHFAQGQLVPKRGVYKSRTIIDETVYCSITNIGVKPTIGDSIQPSAETHILDYSGDLYGKCVCVVLYDFIREEKKFSSVEELKKQINADIKCMRDERNDLNVKKSKDKVCTKSNRIYAHRQSENSSLHIPDCQKE